MTTPTVRRQLAETLPASVAFAAYEFICGQLCDNPRRVGKELHAPLRGRWSARRGTYRHGGHRRTGGNGVSSP